MTGMIKWFAYYIVATTVGVEARSQGGGSGAICDILYTVVPKTGMTKVTFCQYGAGFAGRMLCSAICSAC